MNARVVQRVWVLLPHARWREGTGKLNQSIGTNALAFALCCCRGEAGPALRDECLSAVEKMVLKLWVPARAVVPGWAAAFCAWSLFSQLIWYQRGQFCRGCLSQLPAAAFPLKPRLVLRLHHLLKNKTQKLTFFFPSTISPLVYWLSLSASHLLLSGALVHPRFPWVWTVGE